jgi:hypothetical protein
MIDVSSAIESDGGLQCNLRSDIVRVQSGLILFECRVLGILVEWTEGEYIISHVCLMMLRVMQLIPSIAGN